MNGEKYLKLSMSLVLLLSLFLVPAASAELKLETANPTIGIMDHNLEVTLTGTGFDENTRVSMYLNSGNSRAITGSVDTPNMAYGVRVSGNYAYVADYNSGLQVIDISTPSNPQIIGSVDTPGSARAVAVVNNTVYVGDYYGALYVLDVSNPKSPVIVGSVDTPGNSYGVTVVNNTAYVADNGHGLQVIDVSNPTSPQIIGSVDTPGNSYSVTVVNNTAYVADSGHGLQVIDVGNPKSPVIIGSVDTPGNAYGVEVVDRKAYVADGESGLQVIDVRDPTNPRIIGPGKDTKDSATGIFIVDDMAYIADGASGLQIVDVSNPADPQILGTVITPDEANDVIVTGGYAYIADRISGLQVIDLSTLSHLQSIRLWEIPGPAYDVAIVDKTAYVASGGEGGLQVIDISTPSNPENLGSVDTPGNATDVNVVGSTAYVADGSEGGLQVIDVSNPKIPVIAGSVDTPGDAGDIAIVDQTAYVADSWGGLQVIDVSNPKNPVIVGSMDTPGRAYGVAVVDNTAYVADGGWGLQVVDVSNPEIPVITGAVDTPGSAHGIAVVGKTAYVTDSECRLNVIDVSNPKSPVIIGSVDTQRFARYVRVREDTAYVADGLSGLLVIDVSVPTSPVIIGSVDTPHSANSVSIIGDRAYVADGHSGLAILPVPVEIDPINITVNSPTEISVTLPSPVVAGHYTLRVFNTTESDELRGAVTFMNDEDYQAQIRKRAVIVAGSRSYPDDAIWGMTQKCADMAYLALKIQGYSKENIYYISPGASDVDGDGENDVDADATRDNLSYAIKTWAKDTNELVLFMTGHGGDESFQLSHNDKIRADDLDDWLDEVQGSISDRIIFIYDACMSGSFISKLDPPEGKERIVITSTRADEYAVFQNNGVLSFSYTFWSHIMLDAYLSKAFNAAAYMMKDQTALLDANGDGITNEKEDNIAKIVIGRGRVDRTTPPGPHRVSEPVTLYGTTGADFWVSDVSSPVVRVWAVIVPPDEKPAHLPVTDLYTVDLTGPDNDGRYTGTFDAFTSVGINRVDFYAEDTDGAISKLSWTTVYQAGADAYEDDDSSDQASVIVLNAVAQRHNFHEAGDEDWVKFYGVEGVEYTLKAYNLGAACDAIIELYKPDAKTHIPDKDSESIGDPQADEFQDWFCDKEGIYYVRVRDNNNGFGEGMDYDLRVHSDIAPESGNIQGYVRDAVSGDGISGAVIKTDNNGSAITLPNGSYIIFHDPGTFNMTTSASGYAPASAAGVQVSEGGMTNKDFDLVLSDDSDGDVTGLEDVSTIVTTSDKGGGGGGGGCFIKATANGLAW